MSLYSDGIIFKFRFQKSRFTPKNRDRPDIYLPQCNINIKLYSVLSLKNKYMHINFKLKQYLYEKNVGHYKKNEVPSSSKICRKSLCPP